MRKRTFISWILIGWLFLLSRECDGFGVVVGPPAASPKQYPRGSFRKGPLVLASRSSIRPVSSLRSNPEWNWEGDDRRWISRIRRRMVLRRRTEPIKHTLILLNIAIYVYQVTDTVRNIRFRFPGFWSTQWYNIVLDVLKGNAKIGPLTRDFIHNAGFSRIQPHRYLTAGFLHGGILHLILNMDALRRLPRWMETGLGAPLYLTTYLFSTVSANMAHTFYSEPSSCLGASGAICGMYGLEFITLLRLRNGRAGRILKGMLLLFLYGTLLSNVSNAAHVGGFLGGILMGLICGPRYKSSYAAKRKWSLEVDTEPREYRSILGFGVKSSQGFIRVYAVWLATIAYLALDRRGQTIPRAILSGLLKPGSLTPFIS